METKSKILAIVGPTASGKTALSITLAREFNGEIISADSRQVYRGLDIGTGKVTEEEMEGVPHHLLDIVEPTEVYTAEDFRRDATNAITDICDRNRLPIIAGGSSFYIDLLRGKSASAPVSPNALLRKELEKLSTEQLFAKLQATDPKRAATIDPRNRRRLVRALEIVDALGNVPEAAEKASPYDWLIIGVSVSKETLLQNFSLRLEDWLVAGFQTEVEQLLRAGVTRERFAELGFEYTLMLEFIDQNVSLNELQERFVQKNWQYAKRQMTWFKQDSGVAWYSPAALPAIKKRVADFLHDQNS